MRKFKFLEYYITSNEDSMTEIRIRLDHARNVTANMTNIGKAQNLSLKLKVKLAKALMWNVELCGC